MPGKAIEAIPKFFLLLHRISAQLDAVNKSLCLYLGLDPEMWVTSATPNAGCWVGTVGEGSKPSIRRAKRLRLCLPVVSSRMVAGQGC